MIRIVYPASWNIKEEDPATINLELGVGGGSSNDSSALPSGARILFPSMLWAQT